MRIFLSTILAFAGMIGATVPAVSADYLGNQPTSVLTVCNDHSVLSRIVAQFDYADANFLNAGLAIEGFNRIQLTRSEPRTDKNLVGRHYCKAYANMTDARSRPVWYLIEEDMGYAGLVGDKVEYCVAGLDPWRVYGADCRSLQ